MDIGSLYTDYYSKAANDAKTSRLSTKAKERLSTTASLKSPMQRNSLTVNGLTAI